MKEYHKIETIYDSDQSHLPISKLFDDNDFYTTFGCKVHSETQNLYYAKCWYFALTCLQK